LKTFDLLNLKREKMRKLQLLFLFLTGVINAQETEFTFDNTRGMTDFVVTNVESKSATEIYKKVIEWIKVTYKNPDKVILSTIENEYVRFEGSSSAVYPVNVPLMGKSYLETKYQIEISIKEGKYKFDVIGMENYYSPSQYSRGGWTPNTVFNGNADKEFLDKIIYKKDGTLRSYYKYINDVPQYFNDLNKSLVESITATVKKSDSW
jgi:hypothetical protein